MFNARHFIIYNDKSHLLHHRATLLKATCYLCLATLLKATCYLCLATLLKATCYLCLATLLKATCYLFLAKLLKTTSNLFLSLISIIFFEIFASSANNKISANSSHTY